MSRAFTFLCASLYAFSLNSASADDVIAPQETSLFSAETSTHETAFETPVLEQSQAPILAPVAPIVVAAPAPKAVAAPFKPFTGKVKGRKVRLRLNANLDSGIVKELNKNDLLSVVSEKGDFWAVEAPSNVKAYVFRGLVLDNVVEANRVNVRMEPHLEGPVIGHLNAGDKIEGTISAENNKWLEIAPPANARFYVAKEYLDYAGGPEVKAQFDKRRLHAEQLVDAAALLSKVELRKHFDEIDANKVTLSYNTIINDFTEFSEYVDQAKESLASFQEAYIQKRINYLEARADTDISYASNVKGGKHKEAAAEVAIEQAEATDKMKIWEPVEEALYLSWAQMNDVKNQQDFYEEQKLAAVAISGIVEPYNAPVKSKPGDFILRDKDLPVGYIYSTQVNLQNLVGKRVTLIAANRSNNNFAFPAYYVLSVE